MEPYWDLVKKIITESDLILEILDARLIEFSRNKEIEKIAKETGRPLIFVVNKSDLVSKKVLKRQIKKLRKEGKAIFISAKKSRDIKILLYAIKKVFGDFGKAEITEGNKKHRKAKADIIVGVLGYPNIGKSSIINAIAHKKKAKVGKIAGTTHGIHWIKATKEIKLIDSPGVIPLAEDDEIRYGLIGARNADLLKNPEKIAVSIIKLFLKTNKKEFERVYEINLKNGNNINEIIEQIARKKRFFLKGELLDEYKTCSMIIKDWQEGKLRL